MYLTHLSLTNFRNFARLDMDMPRGPVLMYGANAQGKTSLLEAIYFLATFVSFHASSDRQLINFLTLSQKPAVAHIVADYSKGGRAHRLAVRLIYETNELHGTSRLRKEVFMDGVKLKINEVVGQFNSVLFLPQMLRVIEGTPEQRRRYLNLALAQVRPRYSTTLSDYARALTQRNALLKQLGERGGDPDQLIFWDEQLASSGAQLISARIHAVQELERLAARIHRELTRGGEVLRLSYLPSYDPLPQPPGQYTLHIDAPVSRSGLTVEQIRQGFQESLTAQHDEQIARGVTTMGPHRDELRFLENGVDLGVYGSRGQVRTAMLALKLAEVSWMRDKTGQSPVLLLDEVLAELDSHRRADFLVRLVISDQVILTTADPDLFSNDFIHRASLWHVIDGRLKQEKEG